MSEFQFYVFVVISVVQFAALLFVAARLYQMFDLVIRYSDYLAAMTRSNNSVVGAAALPHGSVGSRNDGLKSKTGPDPAVE